MKCVIGDVGSKFTFQLFPVAAQRFSLLASAFCKI
jgi:hypothetical protein